VSDHNDTRGSGIKTVINAGLAVSEPLNIREAEERARAIHKSRSSNSFECEDASTVLALAALYREAVEALEDAAQVAHVLSRHGHGPTFVSCKHSRCESRKAVLAKARAALKP